MKNDERDFNLSEDPEFQNFLDLLKSSGLSGEDQEEADFEDNEEFPDLEEELGLNDDTFNDECPMMSHFSEILKNHLDNFGFLGIKWEDEEMIDVLKLLNYKKSTYKIQLDLPEDLSMDEKKVMEMIVPKGELEVDIVKKPRDKITEENFRDHLPKKVFEKEMKSLVKDFIIGLISKRDEGESGID